MKDEMGNRLKLYEMTEAGRKTMPLLPVIARLDGKGFSKFTKGLKRPYDERLSNLMVACTEYLVKETVANCGYTQSDEITLGWYQQDICSQILFDGRYQKLTSILAAKCSVFFNKELNKYLPEKADQSPVFDCRVFTVPTLDEAANCFLWRELDATKNSVSMAVREYYSHNQLMNKHTGEQQEMLWKKGVNWNDYPVFFKRGTYIQKKKMYTTFSAEELEKLPPKHAARTNPNLVIERNCIRKLEMPPFIKVTNRVGVIFFGEDYQCLTKESTK